MGRPGLRRLWNVRVIGDRPGDLLTETVTTRFQCMERMELEYLLCSNAHRLSKYVVPRLRDEVANAHPVSQTGIHR